MLRPKGIRIEDYKKKKEMEHTLFNNFKSFLLYTIPKYHDSTKLRIERRDNI